LGCLGEDVDPSEKGEYRLQVEKSTEDCIQLLLEKVF
jgi:hypothetical protein